MSSCLEKLTRHPLGWLFFLLVVSICIILSSYFHINQGTLSNTLKPNNSDKWLLRPQSATISGGGGGDGRGGREAIGDDGSGACDIYDGQWVWDDTYPLYDSKGCEIIERGYRCQYNGRPDSWYLKWRWQPRHCNLQRFNANVMLEKLENRRVVFVGDSTGRNQWESLICLLLTVISNKSSVYEVNGHQFSKGEQYFIVKIEDYNCTLEYYVAPFLVSHDNSPPPSSPNYVKRTVKLDKISPFSKRWIGAAILVFNTGHWWFDRVTKNMGTYYQVGDIVRLNITHENAYRKAIKTLFMWIDNEVNTTRTHVFLRTFDPSHMSSSGCQCNNLPNLTLPFFPNEYPYYEIVKDAYLSSSKRVNFGLLNVTHMTAQRKDAHQSKYHIDVMPFFKKGEPLPNGYHQDCLHWCLPGVPDTWNELLYTEFLKKEPIIG